MFVTPIEQSQRKPQETLKFELNVQKGGFLISTTDSLRSWG